MQRRNKMKIGERRGRENQYGKQERRKEIERDDRGGEERQEKLENKL